MLIPCPFLPDGGVALSGLRDTCAFVGLISAAPSGMSLEARVNPLPALCRMAALPYPAYGSCAFVGLISAAPSGMFWKPGLIPCPLYAGWRRCLIRPTGSCAFVGLISAAPSGMFLEARVKLLPALLPDGGVALSGLGFGCLCSGIRMLFCNIYKCFAITRVSRRTR